MLAKGSESPNKAMQANPAHGMSSVIDSVADKASGGPAERGGYFEVPGAHLYTVLHRVTKPIARVLLVGPFAAERHSSYIPWVLWARYLAERGIEVLRYDYRGIGESSGAFEEMSFSDWSEDVHLLAKWLKEQSPEVPLVLHGLGVGALLASRAFHGGVGEVLLLWSPPESANQALRSAVVRWINVEQLFKYGDERKPPSAFIQELERGSSVEVEGYPFSGKLWQNSFLFDMPPAMRNEASARAEYKEYKKPVRIIKLGREAAPLVKAGTVADDRAKDFTWLFLENWEWIATSIDDVRNMQ
jgi:pimeloyl-ACP methyl ester carboxylesterase